MDGDTAYLQALYADCCLSSSYVVVFPVLFHLSRAQISHHHHDYQELNDGSLNREFVRNP